MPAKTLAKPAAKPKTKPPRATDWPMALRELPREFGLMVEDFGFTKSSLARYADQAQRGEQRAIDKLEPMKQFFFTMMGLDKENRVVRHEDGEDVGKPVMVGTGEFATRQNGTRYEIMEVLKEERSRWGMRDGPDMVTQPTARKPKPGYHKTRVDEHFYLLAPLLEWVKGTVATKMFGQTPPNLDELREASKKLVGGDPMDAKAITQGDKKAMEAEFDRIIGATHNPVRRDTLEMLKPYMLKGETSPWDGRD